MNAVGVRAANTASVYVYDEKGKLQESIPGFNFEKPIRSSPSN